MPNKNNSSRSNPKKQSSNVTDEQSTFAEIAEEEIAEEAQHAQEAQEVPQDAQVEDLSAESDTESEELHQEGDTYPEDEKREETRLEFYGSELIREKAPEVMEFADKVADNWLHDGNFENVPLPIPNPLAQVLVVKGLQKAKEVEKKLEEKGVFMMARIGADYLKSKIKKS